MTFEDAQEFVTARVILWDKLVPNPTVTGAFLNLDFENRLFTPPAEGVWARMVIQNAGSIIACLSDRIHVRDFGLITFQVFDRQGAGTKQMNKFMDGLRDWLQGYSVSGLEILQGDKGVGSPDSNGFYQINLRFEYRAG